LSAVAVIFKGDSQQQRFKPLTYQIPMILIIPSITLSNAELLGDFGGRMF